MLEECKEKYEEEEDKSNREECFRVVKVAKKNKISSMFQEGFGNIFKKPATERYPFAKVVSAEGFRGMQAFDANLCIGCGLCSRECPARAIEMVNFEGKNRPKFLLDRCIFCYQCAETCPKHAIKSTDVFELATTDKSSLILEPYR